VLYEILKPFAVLLMRLYFRLEARGTEHVPRSGALLLVSNHSSVLDPPLVGGASPRQLSFLAKAELFDIPLFGRFIRAVNARPVRREGSDARALKAALRVLEEGKALLVFPEGTRGPEGTLRDAKPGAGMLAVLSGATVVPVLISGSGNALPRGAAFPRPRKAIVRFGPPLHFKTKTDGDRETAEHRKDAYRAASEEMMRAIAQLQAQAA
jgi:1-acyl-sn-glycerol-3-phosphate acyltransferase